jgi:cyanophycinase
MTKQPKGTLIIIGGHEDKGKDEDREILEFVAEEVKRLKGSLVLMTVASQLPEELIKEYTEVFNELGIERVKTIDVRVREDGHKQGNIDKIEKNSIIFFTGGDQLRITSQIGDSPLYQCMVDHFHRGVTIVGTSAGAAAMPETMLVAGPSDESAENSTLQMAPGLGLLPGVVIDSHFAERGRIGRLLGAVANNPKNLGIGIDEDTAIVVENGKFFRVMGSGAVYVIDGSTITASSLSETTAEGIISIYGVTLHVLADGDCFDFEKRRPMEKTIEEAAGS